MDKKNLSELVRDYWENPETVSIIDKNLHKIEIGAVCKYLTSSDYVADIGCGDGVATVEYAKKVKKCVGIEYSDFLRKRASVLVTKSGLSNITIKKGNVLKLRSVGEKFDVVIVQRLLINLLSWKDQQKGLINIYNILKPGGRFIMIENTNDAFLAMNEMRIAVGLESIPKHWHNRFFDYDKLMEFMDGKFQLLNFQDFGLYYFLTRVYVQMFASFRGYGIKSIKDSIIDQADAAARILFEKFHDRVKISGCRAFGPIQVFVFRRDQ